MFDDINPLHLLCCWKLRLNHIWRHAVHGCRSRTDRVLYIVYILYAEFVVSKGGEVRGYWNGITANYGSEES